MMLQLSLIVLGMAVLGSAYPAPYLGFPYGYYGNYGYNYHPYNYGYYGGYPYYSQGYQAGHGYQAGKLVYNGEFPGSCQDKPDGLYYVDDRNFAYCFSGQKSVQPCAEGSANPPLGQFTHGGEYGVYDFCSINLVAQGYGYNHPPEVSHNGKGGAVEYEKDYKDTNYLSDEFKKEAY